MGFYHALGHHKILIDGCAFPSLYTCKLQDPDVPNHICHLKPISVSISSISNIDYKKFVFNSHLPVSSSTLHINGGTLTIEEEKDVLKEEQRQHDKENLKASRQIRKLASVGRMKEADEIFASLSQPDAYVWSALISAHSDLSEFAEAEGLYHQMVNSSVVPDGHVFLAVLKACSQSLNLEEGMHIHSCILKYGLDSDIYLGNALVRLYSNAGVLEAAYILFKKFTDIRDVVTWSTLIQGYMEYGFSFEAYALFDQMQQEGIHPNEFTLVSTLKACSGIGEIEYGWNVHSFIIQHGFEHNLFIENTLMDMYVKCNNLETALIVLNKLSKQDVLAWSIILGAYAKNQMFEETLDVFCGMQQNGLKPDPVTCILLTKACQNSESLAYGRQIHSLIIENGQELQYDVGSSVVEMYVRCNSLEDAQALFERLPKHELPIWNVIIWGYCQVGNPGKAYQMLNAMEHEHVLPNSEIFERLIRGSLMSGELDKGKEIHSYLVKLGIDSSNSIQNALIDMYTEFGFFDDALQFFNNSSELDIVAWNIVISRYSQFSLNKEAAFFFEKMQKAGFYPNQITWNALISAEVCLENAIDLFWQMQVEGVAPNDTSFVCILQKCSIYGQLNQGMEFHSYAAKFGLDACMIIENMLIDMYAKNNSLETARFIFDKLKKWDVVTWNVMIAGYTMHGHALEALKLFYRMQQNNINPNKSSFVAVLQACASIALLEHGKQIHYLITSKGFELDLHVGNALLDFYAKCGLIQDVHVFLNRLPERDGVAWSTIISGCSKCCNYPLASQCFRDMLSENIKPNASIFLALLSACSHAHRLDEACFYLRIMSLQHGVTPTLEHFMILVELFGKVGLLKEAEELLETLPWSSKPVGWMSLLGSCKKHRSVELARRCFANLMEMREKSSSSYVLLSNIFEEAGMENAVEDVVRSRKHADAWKQPAKSYIEVDNQIHEFIVGDTSHPKCEEIYSKLRTLHSELKNEEGYEPHVGLIHKGLSIKEKEMNLWAHSEKLAVAFGLLCMPEGTTIRVAKNLRVCADCHDVAKLISIRERRDIVIKDTYCIHHFKDGSCCCENFN